MDRETGEKVHGYLIRRTDGRAKVYVAAADAPALAAAYNARQKCLDDRIDGRIEHTTDKAYRRTMSNLTDNIQTAATAHLYYGTADWVSEVTSPDRLDPKELAPAKPAGEPHVDPICIVKGDSIYKYVGWQNGRLYDVGIFADGSLFNPHRYPEADVRTAIRETQERRHQRLSKAAKEAAVTRADRQELRVMEAAQRFVEGRGIGQRSHCYICGKHLTDPESIERGIGPECWQELLKRITERRRSQEPVPVG